MSTMGISQLSSRLFNFAYRRGCESSQAIMRRVAACFERVVPPLTVRRYGWETMLTPIGRGAMYVGGGYAVGKYIAAPLGHAFFGIAQTLTGAPPKNISDLEAAGLGVSVACAGLFGVGVSLFMAAECTRDFHKWQQRQSSTKRD